MYQKRLATPLGSMIALADNNFLYLLEFEDSPFIRRKIEKVRNSTALISGRTPLIDALEHELDCYFKKTLHTFTIPLSFVGSPFQKHVWETLQNIPYGHTVSYTDIAAQIGNTQACRAVARANATNNMAIIVPCHRVINKNGLLGGYSSGIDRKKELLALEKDHYKTG